MNPDKAIALTQDSAGFGPTSEPASGRYDRRKEMESHHFEFELQHLHPWRL